MNPRLASNLEQPSCLTPLKVLELQVKSTICGRECHRALLTVSQGHHLGYGLICENRLVINVGSGPLFYSLVLSGPSTFCCGMKQRESLT